MNQRRDTTITRQAQEPHMVVEDNQWILEDPMTISKTENQSVSTATNMDTWQRIIEERKKNEKRENVSDAIKKDILQKIARESKQ